MSVFVKGITGKGKNRVVEHGNEWLIIKEDGDRVLLESVKDGYLKWGYSPDFEKLD